MAKKVSDYDPILNELGIDHVLASSEAGRSVQGATVTVSGASHATTFAALGLSDMKNATYQVLPTNQTAVARQLTVGSKTLTGFTIAGGAASDVVDLLIFGAMEGQTE